MKPSTINNALTSGSNEHSKMRASSSTSGGDANADPAAIPPSPASVSTRSSPKPATAATIDAEEQHRQNRKVCYIRGVMITTLITATVLVATCTGQYVAADERSNFELQYGDSVAKVAVSFQHRFDAKLDTAKTFSAMITSRYGNVAQAAIGKPPLWPNVTIPDFQEQTAGSLHIADGRALSFNPIITQNINRLQWEAYATESAWILGDERLMTPDPTAVWPHNRTVSFILWGTIYSRSRGETLDFGSFTQLDTAM